MHLQGLERIRIKCVIVQGKCAYFHEIYGFASEPKLLENDENVDIGFFIGTITGYRTKNARAAKNTHFEGGNGQDEKLVVDSREKMERRQVA